MSKKLVLYSKAGCHLCEGLQEKLEAIEDRDFDLEIRSIDDRQDWLEAYQYEVPVLCQLIGDREQLLPRPSPRASVQQIEKMLQKYLNNGT
jgi:glutaredoxin